MSTHLSRKELKQDNVALKVEETTHFLVTHRALVTKVGGVVLAIIVIGLGSWFFISSRRDSREQALACRAGIAKCHGRRTRQRSCGYPVLSHRSRQVRRHPQGSQFHHFSGRRFRTKLMQPNTIWPELT